MKSKFLFSLFGGAVLALILPLTALAEDPIPGVDVKLGKNPGGISIGRGETNRNGTVEFPDLLPGSYVVNLNSSKSNVYRKKGSVVGSVKLSGGAKLFKGELDLAKGRTAKIPFTVPPGPPQSATVTITGGESPGAGGK